MTVTTMWFVLVIVLGCLMMGVALVFLGAALDRNRGRLEQAEEIRRLLAGVRPGRH